MYVYILANSYVFMYVHVCMCVCVCVYRSLPQHKSLCWFLGSYRKQRLYCQFCLINYLQYLVSLK